MFKHYILSIIVILILLLFSGIGDRFMLGVLVTYFFYVVITIAQILLDKNRKRKSIEIMIFVVLLAITGILTYVHLAMNVGTSSLL